MQKFNINSNTPENDKGMFFESSCPPKFTDERRKYKKNY